MRASLVVVIAVAWSACSTPPPPPMPDLCGPSNCVGECRDGQCVDVGEPAECIVPAVVDFGTIAINTSATRELIIDNTTSIERIATVGTPDASDVVITPSGSITLAPMQAQRLTLVWTPTNRSGVAKVVVQRAATCTPVTVTLMAQVVDVLLTWTPPTVDFGPVLPGFEARSPVTFTNLGDDDIALTGLLVSDARFTLIGADSRTVPAHGTVEVTVAFNPQTLGPRTGQLTASTTLPSQQRVSINLRGLGGGPQVSLALTLDFGAVPRATGLTRMLNISNSGTTSLHIGHPRFEFRMLDANTTVGEFVAALPSSYDDLVGIPAGRGMQIPVTLTPASLGTKSAKLVLVTDDLRGPEVLVTLNANVLDFPACSYSLSTPSLDFGRVTERTSQNIPLIITNTGSQPCTLLSADLISPTQAFSLSPTPRAIIAAGEHLTVNVRAQEIPPFAQSHTGSLLLSISSTSQPQVTLPITAQFGSTCLTLPPSIDFRVTALTCHAATRTVAVFNTCTTPVTLQSATKSGSSEFTLTSPAANTVIVAGTPVNLTLDYAPTDVGVDDGFVRVTRLENGTSVESIIRLRGEGSVTGENVERTQARTVRGASVLIVVDNSSSMSGFQAALSVTARRLGASLPNSSADLQFSVIDTSLSGPTSAQLRRTTSGAAKINRLTPNADDEFASFVNVGLSGGAESCLDPATRVLSDRTNEFPRGERTAVLCITDSGDQAPYPVSQYLSVMSLVHPDNPRAFRWNVIGPFAATAPPGCVYDDANDGRHAAAVSATHGVQREICGVNFDTAIADSLTELLRDDVEFPLKARPDLASTLVVEIDGTAIPMGWRYDATLNAIVFDPLFAPGPGREVTVRYAGLCL